MIIDSTELDSQLQIVCPSGHDKTDIAEKFMEFLITLITLSYDKRHFNSLRMYAFYFETIPHI